VLLEAQENLRQKGIPESISQQWQREQEERIVKVGEKLIELAPNAKEFTFHLAISKKDSGGIIDPDSVNAWTNGWQIFVTRGMMRFIKNDHELAVILGHKISHANSVSRKVVKRNIVDYIQTIAFATVGIPPIWNTPPIDPSTMKFNHGEEKKSDYEGLQWAYKAGYDISGGPALWERFFTQIPGSVKGGFLSSHPWSTERFLHMQEIIRELTQASSSGSGE